MNTIIVSATAARNKFFQLLDQVAAGTEVIIKKDKKEIAVLSPKKTSTDWEELKKASKAAHGILKEYSIEEISPTRKKGAWKKFGKWDQGLKLKKNENNS